MLFSVFILLQIVFELKLFSWYGPFLRKNHEWYNLSSYFVMNMDRALKF